MAVAATTPDMRAGPILEMKGITKRFPGVVALDDMSFDCRRGEVHALVGENGAGKSTLMKVLSGVYTADEGTLFLDGRQVDFVHPRQAQEQGISIIHQEFNLLPERTVAQNIFLGREPMRGIFVDEGRLRRDTDALLRRLGARESIRPDAKIKELSVAQQQLVEIAKALSFSSQVLVMDEPTAALAGEEVELLMQLVRRLRDEGMAIIYISHRFKEIFDLADRITVIKDGRLVGTKAATEVDPAGLVHMMVGRPLETLHPPYATEEEIGRVLLEVRGGGNSRLQDIHLQVRAGEIVGIAGLQGSGRGELLRALFGDDPFTEGTVLLGDAPVRIRSPWDAVQHNIGFLTEDRKEEGLALSQSVWDNVLVAFRTLQKLWATIGGHGPARMSSRKPSDARLDPDPKGTEAEATDSRPLPVSDETRATDKRPIVADLTGQVDLRAAGLQQEVRFLSGGNQQKVVLAKWLAVDADVLMFSDPTRGIDVNAKAGIHKLIRGLARSGKGVLMASQELHELIGMSDRIIVMWDGRIAGQLPAGATESEIMLLATGQSAAGEGGTAS